MNRKNTYFFRTPLLQALAFFLVSIAPLQGIVSFLPQQVNAASTTFEQTTIPECSKNFFNEPDDIPPSIDLNLIKDSPEYTALYSGGGEFKKKAEKNNGWYSYEDQIWYFCSDDDVSNTLSPVNITSKLKNYLNAATSNSNAIQFTSGQDKYALTGEPCTQWKGSICDETRKEVPAVEKDAFGQAILDKDGKELPRYKKDGAGNIIKGNEGKPVQDVDFIPKFYTEVWDNGKWDPPQADKRILNLLTYLVTPVDQGGAGREFIKVGKILEKKKTDTSEFDQQSDDSKPDSNEILGLDQENDVNAVLSTRLACGAGIYSPHYYDINKPGCIAQAVDITQVDRLRVTTKITTKKLLGKDTVTWQYQNFPISVAYQTEERTGGVGVDSPPPIDLFNSAQSLFSTAIQGMLGEFGLEVPIDLSKTPINNFGDVARVLGQSALSNALGVPNNSFTGEDPATSFENMGRAWIAQNLGLSKTALLNKVGNPITNIGQATTEEALGLPHNSLTGANPDETLTSIGRRYVEQYIFNIAEGSLDSGKTGPIKNGDDLYRKIGEGSLAQVLSLPVESIRGKTLAQISENRTLFTSSNIQQLNDRLGLGAVNDAVKGSDLPQLSSTVYETATEKLFNKSLSLDEWYKIVGTRTISAGIGTFKNKPLDPLVMSDSESDGELRSAMTICGPQVLKFTSSNPLLRCNPNNISAYLTDEKRDILVKTGIFTAPEFDEMRNRLSGTKDSNRFVVSGSGGVTGTTTQLQGLYNEIIDPTTGFLTPLQKGLDRVNNKINSQLDSEDEVLNPDLLEARKILSTSTGKFRQFTDGILDFFDQAGQGSARSAGVRMTGASIAFDAPTGKINSVTYGKDPINSLLQGDASVFKSIGKQYLALATTTDKTAQHKIASLVGASNGNNFSDITQYGLSDADLFDKGLVPGDFQRLFEKGLSELVFNRVGTTELQRTLGRQGDTTYQPQNANLTQKLGVQELDYFAQTQTAGLDFYKDRFNQIRAIATKTLGNSPEIQAIFKNGSAGSINGIINQLQPVEKAFFSTKNTDANQLLQEVQAGRSMTSYSADSFTGTTTLKLPAKNQSSPCFSLGELKTSLQAKDQTGVGQSAKKAAGCQLDSTLNIPSGSFNTWIAGSEHSLESLSAIVGQAEATQNGTRFISGDAAIQNGKKLILSNIAGFVEGLLPNSLQKTVRQYQITPEDVVSMFKGDTEPVLQRVASKALDEKMGWKVGTAANMINPECYGEITMQGVKTTTVRGCTNEEATQIRLAAAGQVGLQKLGEALDFPPSFDITDPGTFMLNYGVAKISESLGLSPNTFKGTFADVRAKNDSGQLLRSFGVGDNPFIQTAIDMKEQILSKGGPDASANAVINSLNTYIDTAREDALNGISDPNSPYWKDSGATAGSLLAANKKEFMTMASTLEPQISKLDPATQQSLSGLVSKANDASKTKSYYDNVLTNFKDQIKIIEGQYKLGVGVIKGIITNRDQIDDVLKAVAKSDLGKKLTKDFLDSKLPPELQGVNAILDDIGCGLNDLLFQSGCSASLRTAKKNLGDISTKELLTDPKFADARGLLYDTLLARSFGANLEVQFNLKPGTIRNMVLEPKKAKEIAIQQGMQLIASQLFTSGDESFVGQAKNAFGDAFLAGFYDFEKNKYSLDFEKEAATAELVKRLGQTIDKQISDLGVQYLGEKISQADRQNILNGDMATIKYFGVQGAVNQLNKALGTSISLKNKPDLGLGNPTFLTNGDTAPKELILVVGNTGDVPAQPSKVDVLKDKAKDAAGTALEKAGTAQAAKLGIDFQDVRAVVTGGSFSKASITQVRAGIRENYISTYDAVACGRASAGPGFANVSGDCGNAPTEAELQAAEDAGVNAYTRTMRNQAQERLRYQAMDIVARQIDPNLPAGFMEGMLKGNSATRAYMMGGYLITSLKLDEKLQNLLGPEMLAAVQTYVNSDFKDASQIYTTVGTKAMGVMQGFLAEKFQPLGITLPADFTASFISWAGTGFNSQSFSTMPKGSLGGVEFRAMSSVLTDIGTGPIFSFADKSLGLTPGTSQAVYNGYKAYQAAQKAIQTANAIKVGQTVTYIENGKQVTTVVNSGNLGSVKAASTQQATLAMKQMKADLISFAINTVFADQIAGLETSLGLAPGSGSLLVSIGVNLILGLSVTPLLVAFVVMNILGGQTTVEVEASSDGTYPLNPPDPPYEHRVTSPDYEQGHFDAMEPKTYQKGVKLAAQIKVNGVLRNSLQFPELWSKNQNIDPDKLWISQGFTYDATNKKFFPKGYLNDLDSYISAPAPYDTPKGLGYGPLENRADTSKPIVKKGITYYEADPMNRSGYFPDPHFFGHMHFRW